MEEIRTKKSERKRGLGDQEVSFVVGYTEKKKLFLMELKRKKNVL
jgi:hypothetical protein